MSLFVQLLSKILPMTLLILLGFVAGKNKKIHSEGLGLLLIYFIIPVVIFFAVLSTPMTLSRFMIPVFSFLFCILISKIFRFLNRGKMSGERFGIWSYGCSTGNSGYFGIPVTYFLLGPDYVGLTVLSALGFVIYENTFGFYYIARAHYSVKESLNKLLHLPSLWAFVLALIFQKAGVTVNELWKEQYHNFRGAYTLLGMMMLGVGLAHLKKWRVDIKLLGKVFFYKFCMWPLLMTAFLIFNQNQLHFFDSSVEKILFLISLVPLPANAVAFAATLNTEPEETALLVFLSTLFALFFIPLVLVLRPL